MAVRDPSHWTEKLQQPAPCHYGDPWLDRYSDWIRKAAVKRVFPPGVRRVLDVGCGDGRFGAWVAHQFGCEVVGVDPFDWPGVRDRVRFLQDDGETLVRAWKLGPFDLALFVTSLPFMANWERAVTAVRGKAKQVLVVENLQTPAPVWQQGLPEKEPIEYDELVRVFAARHFFVASSVCVNVVDRRGFSPLLPVPEWCGPACAVGTFAVDWVLSRWVRPDRGRYAAVLFRRGNDDAVPIGRGQAADSQRPVRRR